MSADLIGIFSILAVSLITSLISFRNPQISIILLVALIIRISFILYGHYISPLPESSNDAATFERQAWFWSQNGLIGAINSFPGFDSYFISWVIGIMYSITSRSILLAQSMSLFFGMGSIYLTWVISKKFWNTNHSKKILWIISLFPSLILYSCLTLREAYVWFFLLIAIYGVILWVRGNKFLHIIVAFFGFFIASLFHGGMIVGAFIFFLIISFKYFKKTMNALFRYKIHVNSFVFTIAAGLFAILIITQPINFPKIGSIKSISDSDRLINMITVRNKGYSAYPEWTIPNSKFEIIYKAPVRIFYFMFSPFIWDVKKVSHFLGFFDSILYLLVFYLMLKNHKKILSEPALRIILIISLSYIIVFGLVIGNFGTAIRHRAKFIILILILIAPFIPRIKIRQND